MENNLATDAASVVKTCCCAVPPAGVAAALFTFYRMRYSQFNMNNFGIFASYFKKIMHGDKYSEITRHSVGDVHINSIIVQIQIEFGDA